MGQTCAVDARAYMAQSFLAALFDAACVLALSPAPSTWVFMSSLQASQFAAVSSQLLVLIFTAFMSRLMVSLLRSRGRPISWRHRAVLRRESHEADGQVPRGAHEAESLEDICVRDPVLPSNVQEAVEGVEASLLSGIGRPRLAAV